MDKKEQGNAMDKKEQQIAMAKKEQQITMDNVQPLSSSQPQVWLVEILPFLDIYLKITLFFHKNTKSKYSTIKAAVTNRDNVKKARIFVF